MKVHGRSKNGGREWQMIDLFRDRGGDWGTLTENSIIAQ